MVLTRGSSEYLINHEKGVLLDDVSSGTHGGHQLQSDGTGPNGSPGTHGGHQLHSDEDGPYWQLCSGEKVLERGRRREGLIGLGVT